MLAELEALGDGSVCRITLPGLRHASPGEDLYLRVPGLAHAQWHGLTVASVTRTHAVVLVSGTAGEWSRRLCALAGAARAALVDVEGPYAPWGVAHAHARPVLHLAGSTGRKVLVLVGGVGVTVLGGLAHACALVAPRRPGQDPAGPLAWMTVVWSTRGGALVHAMMPGLRQLLSLGARVRVHVSGGKGRDAAGGADVEQATHASPLRSGTSKASAGGFSYRVAGTRAPLPEVPLPVRAWRFASRAHCRAPWAVTAPYRSRIRFHSSPPLPPPPPPTVP